MKRPNRNTRTSALSWLVAIAICLAAAGTATAATRTWNGGAVPDGNWLTAGNWNGVAPTTDDVLVFTGGTQTATTNNYSPGTPFNNVSFNATAGAFSLNGNSLLLSSPTDAGSGLITGGSISSASASTETIRTPIVLASGNHTISSSGGGTLKLNGTLTHSNGAVATMTGNINVTGGLSTNGSANGILGGWAIFNNNWATLDGNSNVVAYAGYTDVAQNGTVQNNPASNVRIPFNNGGTICTAATSAGTTAINSLFFGSTTASVSNQLVNIGTGNKLVLGQNGGIFNNTAVAGAGTYRNLIIGGANATTSGILTAGDGINPATITFGSAPLPSASGFCTVNASIQNNGAAPVTVVVAGAYVSFNGTTTTSGANMATNTHSGGTYILQGRVSQPNPFTFGSGPVYIVSGGQANMGCPVPNDFYIEGSGTVENQGMGALRLYTAGGTYGYTGNLPGTIHLTGLANICADNIDVATQLVGISGKITGPGSLGIGSPTATTRSGIINIGSTNGAADIPNDYSGDTRINGITGGNGTSKNSILRICNAADNNIMPHGITGSYAGGRTGNLILNANNTYKAIFDLNGSTQTINGLSSTATSPSNNLIQDNGAGNGTLVVGDSDATSTFGGVIQNSIVLNKIGNGTLTLSGANTGTGDTLISAGRLVTTTASTGAGNCSVSNSAALGVTVAGAGSTLAINNLTFGSSSPALQLSTGTNGNPTAAIVNVSGALTLNGNVTMSLSGVGLTAGGPFTVLTYAPGSRVGAGSFVLGNSPRIVATLNDNTVSGVVSVTIISADSAVKWNGGVDGNWDVNNTINTIWQTVPSGTTTYYIEAGSGNDIARFDDSLTGTPNIALTTTLSPQAITVSNSAVNYLFTGPGKIGGTTGLTKQGNGTLTIANSGNNDFSGDIALTAGSLVISNSSSIANNISGSGALTKNGNGTLTLSGDNSAFSGPVTVNGGTLKVLNTASLLTASATTIANGATLDIGLNSVALDVEPITVSGLGVNNNGAIVNSSGNAAFLQPNFKKVTMTGDTAIGGPGRVDFRTTDAANGTEATLSTGGNAYKLIKLSGSQLQLVGVQVDPVLGDIEVQAGIFGIQGQVSTLGSVNNNLTVFGGATFQLFAVANVMTKPLMLRDGAIVNNNNGANTYGGPVTLQGAGLFNIGGTSIEFTNVIGGAGTLSKVTGGSPMTLSASNTFTGSTIAGAGTLALSGDGSITTCSNITVAGGATLDASGRSDGTLTLVAGQTLNGSGAINGNLTNGPGATVSPGMSIGTLNVSGTVSLEGTTFIEIDKTQPQTSDQLVVGGDLIYGGALRLTNLSDSLSVTDTFQLFVAGSYSGAFNNITPSTPGPGLAWDTSMLTNNGTLGILSTTPAIMQSLLLPDHNFQLSGTGPSGAAYRILAATDVTQPIGSWVQIGSGTFTGGAFIFSDLQATNFPQRFYRVVTP